MKDEFLELLTKVASGEIAPENAQVMLSNLVSATSMLFADDIKNVYDIGRAHEKNKSDCTGQMVKDAWLMADDWASNIKRE